MMMGPPVDLQWTPCRCYAVQFMSMLCSRSHVDLMQQNSCFHCVTCITQMGLLH